MREERYAGWSEPLGREILTGEVPLEVLAGKVAVGEIEPQPKSGHQELLENVVNQAIWGADR
jgi:xylose isomerase